MGSSPSKNHKFWNCENKLYYFSREREGTDDSRALKSYSNSVSYWLRLSWLNQNNREFCEEQDSTNLVNEEDGYNVRWSWAKLQKLDVQEQIKWY